MKKIVFLLIVCLLGVCLCGCAVVPMVLNALREEETPQQADWLEEASAEDFAASPVETQQIIDVTEELPTAEPEEQETAVRMTPQPEITAQPEPVKPQEISYVPELKVYSIAREAYVRPSDVKDVGRLNDLSEDEFFTPVLSVENNTDDPLAWSSMWVTLDDGERWGWTAGELPSGARAQFHIFYSNMQKVGEGAHTVRWYMDGEEIGSYTFTLQRDLDWEALTDLPTEASVAAHNAYATNRSPYMAVWMDVPGDLRYTEYMIDFKADYAPMGSYFAIGNWVMDYSALERQYKKVYTEYGITGYAGFQNIHNGEKICIMSIWDVYCEDGQGNVTTIRARQTYPEDAYKSGEFGGEGVGAQCLVEYDWKENHWYRSHLKCREASSGNTQLEYWVIDLEDGTETLLCAYDLGVKDVVFKGDNCFFLENYIVEHAGEIRTMEVRNVKALDAESGKWRSATEGTMYPNGGALQTNYVGSYDYGVQGDRIWIMTTGVGDRCDDSAGKHLKIQD